MVFSREVWDLRDSTPPNKGNPFQTREKPFQTRETLSKQGKTLSKQGNPFPNKKKHQQTRETPFEQGKRLSINKKNTFQARKRLSSKGYLPIKCKSLQVVGVSGQGKAVVSDGGYGVIGGRYCLLVWGMMRREPRENGGGDGVG